MFLFFAKQQIMINYQKIRLPESPNQLGLVNMLRDIFLFLKYKNRKESLGQVF